MIQYLRNALKPSCYHGKGKEPPFFEGWYFKLIDASENHTFAVIPGIFFSEDYSRTYSFVQVMDGGAGRVTVHQYPAENFSARDGVFNIRIGANHFSTKRISLNINDSERTVQGELKRALWDGMPGCPSWNATTGWSAWTM
jgi:hypothetical protein